MTRGYRSLTEHKVRIRSRKKKCWECFSEQKSVPKAETFLLKPITILELLPLPVLLLQGHPFPFRLLLTLTSAISLHAPSRTLSSSHCYTSGDPGWAPPARSLQIRLGQSCPFPPPSELLLFLQVSAQLSLPPTICVRGPLDSAASAGGKPLGIFCVTVFFP